MKEQICTHIYISQEGNQKVKKQTQKTSHNKK